MMTLTSEQIQTLKTLMTNSVNKGNLANAGLVIENGATVATAESLVASNYDATDHSERMLVSQICRERKSCYTPGLTMVTVVEPCIMCMSACSQAGYDTLAYIVPARDYLGKVNYVTDIDGIDKHEINKYFVDKMELVHLHEYEVEFRELFEQLMHVQKS